MREGEEIAVPCEHCFSVSIRLTTRAGVHRVSCAKFGHAGRIRVAVVDGRWSVVRFVDGSADSKG